MSLSEHNTPSHGAGAGSGAVRQRMPPDVEEALSSMLWTPYERTPMPSSSEGEEEEEEEEEDDDERLNRKLHKSHSSYEASALNQPSIHPQAHSFHLHSIYAHRHPPAVESVPLLLSLPLALPLPPVPSFPNFSLSAFDAAIAGFDLAKAGQAATAEGSGASRGGGGRRNRYSYPSYYGSPAHTLTQWCSSAATAIQEPPSYESLYSAKGSTSTSTSLLAMSSVARPRSGSQPETEPCDRSQRSPMKAAAPLTANVPAERLVRSFTDDYISQNCASFTPDIKQSSNKRDTETTNATEMRQRQKQSPATNARSQQSREKTSSSSIDNSNSNNSKDSDCSSSEANCIINEQRRGKAGDEHEMAKATTRIEETSLRADRQVTQPVSCAIAAGEGEREREHERERDSHSQERPTINPTITRSTNFNAFTTTGSSSSGTSNFSYKNSSDGSVLRPNKCLAELERLYAEFRASESRFERGTGRQSDIDNANIEMRLNVPANAVAVPPTAAATANANPNTNAGSSSSVFLNAVSSNNNHSESPAEQGVSNIAVLAASTATGTAKSCQRQPSLTIQVNNSNNNNNNNNSNNNNNNSNNNGTSSSRVSVASSSPTSSIVNNNNGVCVVEINNSVPAAAATAAAAKVFSATSVQNLLNNNTSPSGDKQQVATPQAPAVSSISSNHHVNDNSVNIINVNATTVATTPPRTFTSTECQTDDLTASPSSSQQQQQQIRTREQRRRERRERRQQQQQQFSPHHPRRHHAPPSAPPPQLHPPPHLHHPHPAAMGLARALLPDILHPHYPPPYSALPVPVPITVVPPPSQQQPPAQQPAPPPPPPLPPSVPPAMLTSVISTVPLPGPGPAGPPLMSDGRFTLPLPIMRRSPSERSGKGCCGQWFAGPPLRALIAVVALGGVACALGGAALGATGLAGPPNSHLTAALLMIGVGVVLVTVSGAAWRMTAPGGQSCLGLGLGASVDLGRCGRRPCSRGGGAPHGLLYPEFQHRPPPPSYQASMQEYRLRLLLLDRDRQNGVVRGNSPPPTYRSHAGSLLRAPLTTLRSGMGGGGAGGTISSSMGGSEYSLPPSYRSRNATPASFVGGERNIETAPSGRLLANEDLHLPEPSLAEQLTNYTTLQSNTLLTSAIVEIERNGTPTSTITTATSTSTATKGKDLVTIVTISQADSGSPHLHSQRNSAGKTTHGQTQTQSQSPGQASALDQIDILAHL
ncbi:ataxin-2 homolog isoform X1 [Drosophila pseudoobscura]|uniref:Ataxin-2 homolog isoform X1 n=1 Tax=Drosophila pseudoobscura pseudoobscura TaxID=46245 RepID=A0A6I8V517_DROPS|nr:ataxin-2 homolog isoform X1 [Drosophila pseudoobscura]